ncbi:hypothetical protein V6Z11_A02G107100 [Gossypium hirsutum]
MSVFILPSSIHGKNKKTIERKKKEACMNFPSIVVAFTQVLVRYLFLIVDSTSDDNLELNIGDVFFLCLGMYLGHYKS